MASQAQLLANAANAQLSTGPRTPEGKAAASKNATRHGLSAGRAVVFPHEQEEYADLRAELTQSLDPQGALELAVFEQLAGAAWGLRRLRILELHLHESANFADPLSQIDAEAPLRQLARYRTRAERSLYAALAQLRQLQNDRASRDAALTAHEAENFPVLADLCVLPKRVHPDLILAQRRNVAEGMVARAHQPATLIDPLSFQERPNPLAGQVDHCLMGEAVNYIWNQGLPLEDFPAAQSFYDEYAGMSEAERAAAPVRFYPDGIAPELLATPPSPQAMLEAFLAVPVVTDEELARHYAQNNPAMLERFPSLKVHLRE
jgi:hypothetical protein